jgi:hypothetical protein
MSITLQLPSGQRISVEASTIVIGRDPSCNVALAGETRIQPRHATIRKVAGKWMVQSEGNWAIRVGNGVPGGKAWVNPGEEIHLTEAGPTLVFAPTSVVAEFRPHAKAAADRGTAPAPDVSDSKPPPLPWAGGNLHQVSSSGSKPPPIPAPVPSPGTPPSVPATPSGDPSSIALWNPTVVRVLGFFLSWGFGSWLLASNWKALGQPEKARRAMFWFYGLVAFLIVNLFVPGSLTKVMGFLAMGTFVAWVLLENEPQRKLVLATYGKQYVHRPWGKPVGIAVGCFVAYMVLALAFVSSEGPNVVLVKTGHLGAYPNVPVGKAVDSFLSSPRWDAVEGKDNNEYVNVRGGAQYQGKPVRVALQFRVDRKAGSFEINALEVNDLPQNNLMKAVWLSKIFESYRP